MDQSEIDALLKAGNAKPVSKPKKAPAPKAAPAPVPDPTPTPVPSAAEPRPDREGQVISEIDAVTAVTERETNKVMDQLDIISQLVAKQQDLVLQIMEQPEAQAGAVHQSLHDIMLSGKTIQEKVFEAMDLMQFQDITRQKLERIVYHLRQIHDYIVELLGTGLKSEGERANISRTIATTGTTPDERRSHADTVIEEFKRNQKKG
ncbi:MAG: hypothetical protein LWX11_08585 [Firmicutes bacterium]|nr:hypothetical protein [Bacillota bacterium]